MPAVPERLRAAMDRVVLTDPLMHLATMTPYLEPHSSSVWFVPDTDLCRVFWLSSTDPEQREHSAHIAHWSALGRLAMVSGSMAGPHRVSMPVEGVSFRGYAQLLTEPAERAEGLDLLFDTGLRVFAPDEMGKYLEPYEGSGIGVHGVYKAVITRWSHFNGMLPPEEKKAMFVWPPDEAVTG